LRNIHLENIRLIVALLAITMFLTGCLGGSSSSLPLAEMVISAEKTSIVDGETLTIAAVGTDTEGNEVIVSPEWVILSGTGSLEPRGHKAFLNATGWDYAEGDTITVQAFADEIAAEPLTIGVIPLLQSPVTDSLFPKPESPHDPLPSKTDYYIVEDREPVDHFRDYRVYMIRDGGHYTTIGWHEFVKDGELLEPGDPDIPWWGEAPYFTPYDYADGPLPEPVYLSHRVHYELVDAGLLYHNASYSQTISFTRGTSKTEATEFVRSTSSEVKSTASWGWGEVTAELKTTVEEKTSQSVTVEESRTVSETKAVNGRDDYITRFGVYTKVDTFYLSDVNGVPIDVSPIFAHYYLNRREVSVNGSETAIVTHRFAY